MLEVILFKCFMNSAGHTLFAELEARGNLKKNKVNLKGVVELLDHLNNEKQRKSKTANRKSCTNLCSTPSGFRNLIVRQPRISSADIKLESRWD